MSKKFLCPLTRTAAVLVPPQPLFADTTVAQGSHKMGSSMRFRQSWRRKFIILGMFATATVLFLAPRASAGSFTSTFNLGSMNVSDFSVPPNFLTGPFNYGFTPLALDTAATGPIMINSISVSADATLHHLPFYGTSPFDWEIFVGPAHFGFAPGQITGTTVLPGSITSSAPTQLRFTQLAGTTVGGTTTLTGSYDFVSDTFHTSNTGSILRFAGTSSGEFTNGLYAQVFLWSEGGDSINLDFSDIKVTVNSTVVPEPSTFMMLGAGVLPVIGVIRRRLNR